jgi:hypothetical protein
MWPKIGLKILLVKSRFKKVFTKVIDDNITGKISSMATNEMLSKI